MGVLFEVPSAVYGVSFIDVTCTGVTRGESLARNQQRNWETVLQTFGLLTQPLVLQVPEEHFFNSDDNFAGSELFKRMGKQHQFVVEMLRPDTRFWIFAIGSERADVLDINTLLGLFDLVPVIPNLNETIILKPSVFHTSDSDLINIQFFAAPTIK
jgi:hypothetical protein|tara:strand:+ start:64 stop:531 length:468 start_codon:yes stop_codon:yes gene_type:complete